MTEGNARAGAPAFIGFMSGISATNTNADPHITAIGHSYGSLTVGQSALTSKGIPGVDDIVLLGSPGTGAETASDLGVGKDHVFVGAAENDPVTKLPSKAEGTGLAGGATVGGLVLGPPGAVLSGAVGYGFGALVADDNERWFGIDPASTDFGARRFKVDDGPRPFVDGQAPTAAHSNYFDPKVDAASAANVAAVVANRSDLIVPEEGR
ncbi:alpha/beta hydrolase [Streptomyces sp. MST-110588]|uniref:alpha/beta hydrolase n=1 Tax=Streptomyces sp. MST-110588 TaxID=2833628 RepID=UPI003242230F